MACAAVLACVLFAVPAAHAEHSVFEYASGGTTGGNGTQHVGSTWAAADGSRVFFITTEALTADDTDTQQDIYEHVVGGGTSLVSTSPTAGNGSFPADFHRATPSGSHVLFSTKEPLVAADTDTQDDIYQRAGGATTLISTSGTNNFACFGPGNAFSDAITADGARATFWTNDRLVPEDTDCGYDVYERSGSTTTLVSKGSMAQPSGSFDNALPSGSSSDLSTVYFQTSAVLEPDDTDTSSDIYKREGGVTTLVSTGPDGGNGAFGVHFGVASRDGSSLNFVTAEPLVTADTDTQPDIYLRQGTTTSLVSIGPAGGNGAFPVTLLRTTPDGSHGVLSTQESLVAGDTDTRTDLYEYTAGGVELVSTGPAGGNGAFDPNPNIHISDDGAHVIFMTAEKLVSADTDTFDDGYDRSGGVTSLVSPGTGNSFSFVRAINSDASRIFFDTNERLVGADTDGFGDVYERSGNDVTLISPAPLGGNSSFGPSVSQTGVSQDGSRVFFTSGESYAAADMDNSLDVYMAATSGAPPAPGYPRPKSASPLQLSLVPAYQQCTNPNMNHGPPLAFGSCNPPSQTSGSLTVGTPDANGSPASSTGSVRFAALVGDPATMADEADVKMNFTMTDVRLRSTLADYTGQLQSTTTVRITDKRNGTGIEPATMQDVGFPVQVPCTATAGSVGATCNVTTTFDAVTPGVIAEGRRSIWEIDKVRVNAGAFLFATQGIFVP